MPRLKPEIEAAIWDRYFEDRPQPGKFTAWSEKVAADVGCVGEVVLRIIRNQQANYLDGLKDQTRRASEEAANFVGATLLEAVARLAECMNASKLRPIRNRDGSPALGADGKPLVLEQPDWSVREKAACDMIRIHSGFPAEKVDITERNFNLNVNLTGAELLEKAHEVAHRIESIRASISRSGSTVAIGAAGTGVDSGDDSPEGQLLLVDRMHEDEGRTGPPKPVQAIPQAEVHPPAAVDHRQ